LKREKKRFFWSKNQKNVKKQRFWAKKRPKMRFPTWRPESLNSALPGGIDHATGLPILSNFLVARSEISFLIVFWPKIAVFWHFFDFLTKKIGFFPVSTWRPESLKS